MTIRYTGLIAPQETPTGDGRMFSSAGGTTRPLPIPVMAKFTSGGHTNAVIVGNLVSWFLGPGGRWGTVEMFDPAVVPEVVRTCYLLDKKALGPSVDLDQDYVLEAVAHPKRVDQKAAYFREYNAVGVTLVPMPAFAEVHLSVDTKEEQTLLASAGVDLPLTHFDINLRAWDAWPLADRKFKYDADDAVKRIAAWAGIGSKKPSLDHYASAFLWRNGTQAAPNLAQEDFRLPLCDIINGQPHLIYHAVYAAAALLSGGHGGLPNIPQPDQDRMKSVINAIYAKMAQAFGDDSMKSPFAGNQMSLEEFATEPYGDVEYADPGYRDDKKRYPIDTEEHIRAAWSYINQQKNAAEYDAEQLAAIKSKIKAAAKKHGIEIAEQMAVLTAAGIVRPRREFFMDPGLLAPTPLTVDGGRVFGHLATWRQCHVGIGNACVMAPKSYTDYSYFKNGRVLLDDGRELVIGKITLGTGHADEKFGMIPARDHYDNSGWAAAIVNVGEDVHGIWVNGVLTASMTAERVEELRRSPLSGDWREVKGNLELVAALAVNSPGFPVIRSRDGNVFSMLGVGVVVETDEAEAEVEPETVVASAAPDTKRAERLAALEAAAAAREATGRATRFAQLVSEREERQEEGREGGLAANGEAFPGQATLLARQYDAVFQVVKE